MSEESVTEPRAGGTGAAGSGEGESGTGKYGEPARITDGETAGSAEDGPGKSEAPLRFEWIRELDNGISAWVLKKLTDSFDFDVNNARKVARAVSFGILVLAALLVCTAIASLVFYLETHKESAGTGDLSRESLIFALFIYLAVILGLFTVALLIFKSLSRADERLRAEVKGELEQAAERLREKMELPSLLEYNRARLNQYHETTTQQARRAFRNSLIAIAVGLAVLALCTLTTVVATGRADRVVVGSIAVLGTVFSGYLGRTYVIVYYRTLSQMNRYFSQPVIEGYLLTAERVAERIQDSGLREENFGKIVDAVLESGRENQRAVHGEPDSRSTGRPGRRSRGSSRRGRRSS
ncbi:hypothetical protein JS756_31005 [Streptomyces actuosus]|uniref:DUF4231 domain-containing protein n=1 Tax=Streptomyces actuosus TaxID=1885 RepID=A0ABS2VZP5_STRAS|nr:hypothetical protein [Streptomyces actuosus]MBN0048455.1 hypothetical protein [Streptomyces actuosus]